MLAVMNRWSSDETAESSAAEMSLTMVAFYASPSLNCVPSLNNALGRNSRALL